MGLFINRGKIVSEQKPLKVIAGAPDQPLVINDIEIPCYVLENEERVLSQRGLQSSIGLGTGGGLYGTPKIVEFVNKFPLSTINNDLIARLKNPIIFSPPWGRTAYGYPAAVLVDLCNIILEADKQGLAPGPKHVVDRARILLSGLATVGIIGLVDEATGYQRIREERALATILERFIDTELQPWTKTFPYEFYEQIFRLKRWEGPNGVKRPQVIGHYTNDFVYSRLAPGILNELRRINPRLPSGELKNRHHQWFTPDLGHPRLKEHLAAVIALMKISTSWDHFIKNVNQALPQRGSNFEILFENERIG